MNSSSQWKREYDAGLKELLSGKMIQKPCGIYGGCHTLQDNGIYCSGWITDKGIL